jgi:oligopeptide transport system permease protein
LGSVSFLLALFFGVSLGAVAAWKKNTWLDWSALWLSIAGISLPTYLIASFLVYAFAIQLNWLPAALYDSPLSLVLPVITLAIRPLSMFVRLTRSSVLDVMQSDFIRTAQAKGLPQSQVLFKHVLKNSLIPVITLLGPMTANLLTGSFLVEVIFQLPGLGKYFVGAVMNRDYPLVMGVTLIYGIFLTFSNLLSDILCAWVDPRIQIANESKI